MFITRLRLINFKGIEDETFENWTRINGLFGRNGSNKSSVIQAVQLVVLSKTPKKVKLEDYIGDHGDDFTIECDFRHQEIDYKYKLHFDGTSNKTLAYQDKIKKGRVVNTYLNDLFDPALTLNSAFSMQGETDSILEENPAERLESLKKILLDKEALDEREATVDRMVKDASTEILEKETAIKILQEREFTYEELEPCDDNRNELRDKIDLIERNKQAQDEAIEKYKLDTIAYEQALEDFQAVMDEYNTKIQELDKAYNDELAVYNQYVVDLGRWDRYQQEMKLYTEKKTRLTEEIKKLSGVKEPKCEYCDDDLEKARKILGDHVIHMKELETKFELATSGKCDKCGADYSNINPEPIMKEIKLKMANEDEMNENIHTIQEMINRTNELHAEWKADQKTLEQKKKELENILVPEKIDKPVEIKEPTMPRKPRKPLFDMEKPTPVDEVDYSTMKSDIEKFIMEIDFIIKKNEEINARNAKVKAEQESIDSDISEKEKELEDLTKQHDWYKQAKKIIRKDLPVYIINKGIRFIKHETNKFFKQTYDKYSIDISATEKGDSIEIYFNNGVKNRNVALASGAEKQIIATAFRIALCKLQDTGLFIADEIDCFTDDERSNNLIPLLCENDDFEQILLVTHNNITKAIVANMPDSYIYTIDDGKLIKEIEYV
jgi:DNA repair exonuclease SbcCD ATPase subunit